MPSSRGIESPQLNFNMTPTLRRAQIGSNDVAPGSYKPPFIRELRTVISIAGAVVRQLVELLADGVYAAMLYATIKCLKCDN